MEQMRALKKEKENGKEIRKKYKIPTSYNKWQNETRAMNII